MIHDILIELPWELEQTAPPFEGNDVRSPEGLYRHIIKKYTKKGGKIFDPFVGLGTTMFTAEELSRVPYGIEADPNRHQWVAGQLENWTHIVNDDAANIARYDLPKMDLILTCPPYMTRFDKWNPLYDGDPKYAGYDAYLKRMTHILSKLPSIMKKETLLILEAQNITKGTRFTPLTHDLVQCAAKSFKQVGETNVRWENPKPNHPLTTLLIFKKK